MFFYMSSWRPSGGRICVHPRLCIQILRYVQDDKERNTSLFKEENVILRPIKRRFLKSHIAKIMQAESRTNLFDYAEAQLIFVRQRYNIGIAVVKYFGIFFRASGGIFYLVKICWNISNIEKVRANIWKQSDSQIVN